MKILRFLSIALFSFIALSFNSCSDDDSSSRGTSSISVKLVDDPGDYDNVYIDVVDIMVKYADNEGITDDDVNGVDESDDNDVDEGSEWVSLNAINTGVYDILELTGGIDALLVDDFEIPSGMLEEIRLILGDDNSIVIDGVEQPLRTPSAQQSGLKIKVNETLEPNFSYTFILDFDADKSIVRAGGSGNINLKPVIRASVEALTGAISGTVSPAGFQTKVTATQDGIDVISTYADINGNFLLVGTTPGNYTITFTPDAEAGYEIAIREAIGVSLEQTTDMGTIELVSEED